MITLDPLSSRPIVVNPEVDQTSSSASQEPTDPEESATVGSKESCVHTQVAIIGSGPAGMLLSHLLGRAGISTVVLERQTRRYVLERIRAGVLEWGTVETLREAGLGDRMDREGHVHDTINIAWRGRDLLSVDTEERIGKRMMAYGQTNIQEDLCAASAAA